MRHCWGTMTMPHTRYGHDQDRSRNMRTRNRRLGPLVQHPPPLPLGGITPQQAENQHTTTRKEAASTSLHKTRDLTHPLRGIAPVTSRCTRYVAIHPLRGAAPVTSRCTRYVALHPLRRAAPEQKGCNAYRSGAMPTHRVHDPPSQAHMRTCPNGGRRNRQAWLRRAATHPQQPTAPGSGTPPDGHPGPAATNPQQLTAPAATHPQQPTGPEGGRARPAFETTSRAGGSRRSRGIKPGPGARAASSPGTTRAHDEAGTRRAKQRRGPRPRQQVRPGDPP